MIKWSTTSLFFQKYKHIKWYLKYIGSYTSNMRSYPHKATYLKWNEYMYNHETRIFGLRDRMTEFIYTERNKGNRDRQTNTHTQVKSKNWQKFFWRTQWNTYDKHYYRIGTLTVKCLTGEFLISWRNSERAESACCLISWLESLNILNKPDIQHQTVSSNPTMS